MFNPFYRDTKKLLEKKLNRSQVKNFKKNYFEFFNAATEVTQIESSKSNRYRKTQICVIQSRYNNEYKFDQQIFNHNQLNALLKV